MTYSIDIALLKCPHCRKEIKVHIRQPRKGQIDMVTCTKLQTVIVRATKSAAGWVDVTAKKKRRGT